MRVSVSKLTPKPTAVCLLVCLYVREFTGTLTKTANISMAKYHSKYFTYMHSFNLQQPYEVDFIFSMYGWEKQNVKNLNNFPKNHHVLSI